MMEWSETRRRAEQHLVPLQVPPITVPAHRLTRYLRARLEVTNGVMRWQVPRALLGVVPIGVRHVSVPVADISSLHLHRVVRPFALLVGAACIGLPLVAALWWLALPLAIFGAWVILVSLGPGLEVVTRFGAKHRADVCFAHQVDAELYMTAVDDLARQTRQSR
jgi:hypothetical protein